MDDTRPPHRPAGADPRGEDPPAADPASRGVSGPGPDEPSGALGPYPIEVKLGEGGMGKVYRCLDPTLERRVAVKVLHDKYGQDEHYRARFLREARTVASLSHPSVAQVYSVDTTNGSLSIVMEHVPGRSLDQRLDDEGTFPLGDTVAWIRQAADGLRAAFARGIVHRDVKPSNLLLDEQGELKIVDFGLAKELGAKSSISEEGIVLGTPQYISPEQGRGKPVDHRSDIYSLGASFYHLLTGRPPFQDTSQVALIVAHIENDPRPPHELRPDLPADASSVVGRMMALDPDDRYGDYGELIEDLDALAAGLRPPHAGERPGRFPHLRPARARQRPGRFLAALGAVATLAVAATALVLARAEPGPLPAEGLAPWHVPTPEGGDLLRVDFGRTAPGVDSGSIRNLIRVRPAEDGPAAEGAAPGHAPRVADGALRWDGRAGDVALAPVFRRIDEVRVHVAEQAGHLDLGLGVVHPDGAFRRILLVPLRPAGAAPRPVLARRRGESALAGSVELPPVPRLVAPWSVGLSFDGAEEVTRLRIEIHREPEGRALWSGTVDLEGRGWASGAVILTCDAARRPFRAALERLVVSGELSPRRLKEVPWRS